MLHILDKDTLALKDIIESSTDETISNINLSGKSVFTVTDSSNVAEGDFIIKKDSEITFQGIVSNIEIVKGQSTPKINVEEIESLFDREIIITNESLIASTGIEDFVLQTLKDNFTDSADIMLNISFINAFVLTHTKINAAVDTKDGVYNFRTYLGNVREYYGICLDYEIIDSKLKITISKKVIPTLSIDATIEDVITYQEVYKIDAIAKVTVLATDMGTQFNYFLLNNRTISTDINHLDRAKGSIKVVTCKTNAEAYQKALDTFKGNSYQHNIVLTLAKDSEVYEENDFVIGRYLEVKTENNGIYNTFIREISKKSNSNIYTVTCGNMKVNLIDKLREMKGAIK